LINKGLASLADGKIAPSGRVREHASTAPQPGADSARKTRPLGQRSLGALASPGLGGGLAHPPQHPWPSHKCLSIRGILPARAQIALAWSRSRFDLGKARYMARSTKFSSKACSHSQELRELRSCGFGI